MTLIEIAQGLSVTFLCSSFRDDGTCLNENEISAPITMRAGAQSKNRFASTVANLLIGMKLNETKQFSLSALQAFGEVDNNKIFKIPLRDRASIHVGEELKLTVSNDASKKTLSGIVVNIDGEYAYVDANHPFAGQTIVLEIKILSIQ